MTYIDIPSLNLVLMIFLNFFTLYWVVTLIAVQSLIPKPLVLEFRDSSNCKNISDVILYDIESLLHQNKCFCKIYKIKTFMWFLSLMGFI